MKSYINLDKLACVAGCTFKYPNRFCLLRVSGEFQEQDEATKLIKSLTITEVNATATWQE